MILLLAACQSDQGISRNTHNDVFMQEPNSEVDILWVIDNSNSMAEEQARVADGFESFIVNIEETNIDFQLGVITTDMDLDNAQRGQLLGNPRVLTSDDNYVQKFKNLVQVGTDGSDKEKGLAAAMEALTEPMISGDNLGFLREDAVLSIIFVSDENDCSDDEVLSNEPSTACYEESERLVPITEFIYGFRGVKGPSGARVIASAIVGPKVADGCDGSWPGHRYSALAEGLGGQVGNICDDDYGGLMYDLGLAVSGELNTFQLSYAAVIDTLEVYVDDDLIEEDPDNGWTYDSEYWILRFDGDYVPERGSQISVTYEVAAG